MKLLFVLLVSTFAAHTTHAQIMGSISPDDEQEWTNFKVKFNKHYDNREEELNRMKIFLDNKRIVEEHNARYEKGEVSYKMGLNKFSDLTSEEFKKMMGFKSH